jgi:hypothetical protein
MLAAALILAGVSSCAINRQDDGGAVVPLEIRESIPFVAVKVNDAPMSLILDSGNYSSAIALTADEMRQASVTSMGAARIANALGQVFEVSRFSVERLALGSVVLHDVAGTELKFDPNFAPPGKAGHIGLAGIRDRTLVVDFPRRRIEIHPGGTFPARCIGDEAELVTGDYGIASRFHTATGTLLLGWDTAAQINVLSPKVFGLASGQYEHGELRRRDGSVVAGKVEETSFRLLDIQIPGLDGILGYDYFLTHVVCFNFQGGRIRTSGKVAR